MTTLHTIFSDGTYKSEEYTGPLEYACVPFHDLQRRLADSDPVHHGCDIEHVNVWWNDKLAHMFVDETGRYKPVKRNDRATRIYYNMTCKRERREKLLYTDLTAEPKPLALIEIEQPGHEIVGTALLWEGDME
jgi:hypothetical protein